MIRISYAPQCCGKYWLNYEDKDEAMVSHLLSGNKWDPSDDGARNFVMLAVAHNVTVVTPKRLKI